MSDHSFAADQRVIGPSVVLGAVGRAVTVLWRSGESSATVAGLRRVAAWWRRQAWQDRRRAVGVALLTGVGVHTALVAWQEAPPGWLWLVLPALAAACGAVTLASAGASEDRVPTR